MKSMIVVEPWCGPNHLAVFYKDTLDPNSPVYALYYGWQREANGWYLEVVTGGSKSGPHELYFETKEEMEAFISTTIGTTVKVKHDGPW